MGPETVTDLVAVLYRRRMTVLLVMAGSIGGGLLFLNMVPKTYRATASVLIPSHPTRLSLRSEAANIPQGPIVPDTREETHIGLIGVAQSGIVHERVAELLPGVDSKQLRRNLVLDIDRFKQLNFIAYDRKKERAVLLANTARDALRQVLQEMVERGPRSTLELLEGEFRQASVRHGDARDALVAYLGTIDTPDLDVDAARLFADRARYQVQIEGLDREEMRMVQEEAAILAIMEERPDFAEMSRSFNRNNLYLELIRRIADLETEMAVKGLEYTLEHPVMKSLRETERVARAQLLEQVEIIQAGITLAFDSETRRLTQSLVDFEISKSSLEARRSFFRARLDGVTAQLASLPLSRSQIENLEAEIDRTGKLVDDINSRVIEIRLQLKRGLDFTWTDPSRSASVERTGLVPGKTGVLVFATLSGLIIGVLLALGMEITSQMMRRRPF